MKAVALVSGGIDSSTLLYKLCSEGAEVHPFFAHYGQRHSKEAESARLIAKTLGLGMKEVRVDSSVFLGSALIGSADVPEASYSRESMQATLVPNRNMVLLSLAVAYAESIVADTVAYAAHSGDHWLYPDCRAEFVESMRKSIELATDGKVSLYTPFIEMNKAEIVGEGLRLGVPYELAWSCYKGEEKACGECGTCRERLEAFRANNATDPIDYKEVGGGK